MEILTDKTRSGKEKPWTKNKIYSDKLSDSLIRIGKFNQADRMIECGNFLKFRMSLATGEKRLKWSSFCKNRFCPMCQWRKSLKVFGQVYKVASIVNQLHKVHWVFLTLTVQNVTGDKLSETITKMNEAFVRLSRREPLKSFSYGWFKSLEVTRNNKVCNDDFSDNDWYGTYHPHFHVLIAFKGSYRSKGYKDQKEWSEIWGKCLKVEEYVPRVDIRTVYSKKEKSRLKNVSDDHEQVGFEKDHDVAVSACAEVAKYTVKSKDIFYDYNPITREDLELSNYEVDDVLLDLYTGISRRRLHDFVGLLREVKQALDLADLEDADIDLLDEVPDGDEEFVDVLFSWIPSLQNYFKIKKQEQIEKIDDRIEHLRSGKSRLIKKSPDLATIKKYLDSYQYDEDTDD